LQQQVNPKETTHVVKKNDKVMEWSAMIEDTSKFKIGKISAFSSNGSRYAYIRLLINCFYLHPDFANWSFKENLFNPENGYANFQHLLNTCPVPVDHDGFYKKDIKKAHLQSRFLQSSP
jgi:hypothetical protein